MNFSTPKTFWSRQVHQIKEEGLVAVQRKAHNATGIAFSMLFEVILCALAVPFVFFVRLISPWVLIRIGHLRSDAFGHSVFDPEYYLSEKETENNKAFDCFYFQTKNHPNEQWSLMVRRTLRINFLFRYLDKVNRFIPGGELHQKVAGEIGSRDLGGYLAKTKTHFSFTDEENERGLKFLESKGLNVGDKFICLLVRDSSYKEKYGDKRDWSYHSYRDTDIKDYRHTAITLARKGYWVFRMGKIVRKPFKVDHPRILDYANSEYRSDFLDIWLFANCYLGVQTTAGIGMVSLLFRIPLSVVNALPLGHINTVSNPNTIWLPKNIVWADNKKPLTLKEQINTGVIGFLHSENYKNAKVELVDNLPEEITETVLELEAKLTGNWQSHPQDDQLQNKFWNILKTWEQFPKEHGKLQRKMPDTFLRENHDWFLA